MNDDGEVTSFDAEFPQSADWNCFTTTENSAVRSILSASRAHQLITVTSFRSEREKLRSKNEDFRESFEEVNK
jgi:hypothetical protein